MVRLTYITCLAVALAPSYGFVSHSVPARTAARARSSSTALSMAYVPDGMTAEQYRKIQQKEKDKKAAADLARNGARGFKSRSFKSFQASLERGENAKNYATFNAKERLAKGELREADIPYMQRENGAWDNSDVARRGSKDLKKRTQEDNDFENNPNRMMFTSFMNAGPKNSGAAAKNDEDMWRATGARFAGDKEKKTKANLWGLKKEKQARRAVPPLSSSRLAGTIFQ